MTLRVLREQLATNPRFSKTSGTKVVRTNLAKNPAPASTAYFSVVNDAAIEYVDGSGVRVTCTADGTAGSGVALLTPTDYTLSTSTKYTISVDVTGEVADSWYLSASGTLASATTSSTATAIGVGETQRLSVTFTTSSDVSAGGVYLLRSTAATASQAIISNFLIEKTSVLLPYFDGSYSSDPDLTPAWTGAENASQSTLTGNVPVNTYSRNDFATRYQSQYGMAIVNSMITNTVDTRIDVAGLYDGSFHLSGQGVTFTLGKYYGVSANLTLLKSMTNGSGDLNPTRQIRVETKKADGTVTRVLSSRADNLPGTYLLSVVWGMNDDYSQGVSVQLFNGSSSPADVVYWDKLLIVEGDSEAEVQAALEQGYFDGDSATITREDGYQKTYAYVDGSLPSPSVEYDWAPGVIAGWTATQTGLPSLWITGPRTVRSGNRVVATVADSETVLVSDPLASPGENVYTDGETTIAVSRRDDGNLITDQDGRQATHVAILGDDGESLSSGAITFGESDAVRWPIRTPKRTGTIEVRTDGRDATDKLRNLVESRKLLVAVHSEATCQIPDCDVPPVRSFVQSGRVSNARDGVVTQARRKWDIPYRETTPTSPEAPVVTWGEYADASDGVFTDESYLEVCQRVAGMPA